MHIFHWKTTIFVQKRSQMRRSGAIGLALVLLLAGMVSCQKNRYVQMQGYAQGGVYTVKLNMAGVRTKPEVLKKGIDSVFTLIDTTLSGYNKFSQISRFNEGDTIVPNPIFRDIYARSRAFWEETGGALDCAAGPLFDIWGFGFSTDSMPSPAKVDSVLRTSGMDRMPGDLDDAMGQGHVLNFNAIAQGYTADLVADYLKRNGVEDMLVDIGEIYCNGVNQEGRPWTIGVDAPIDGNETPGEKLEGMWQSDGGAHGIVTSGNYRKFYVRDGKKYAHTIDPRTGYPVQHNLLSATILAPDATTADAMATYCMVIGLDEAKAFITKTDGIEGYLIYDEDGKMKTWNSAGFNVSGQ